MGAVRTNGPSSGGSLSSIYEREILTHLDRGNYVRAYLWTVLLTGHDTFTFGFLSAHDQAYEQWERGEITDDQYLGHTLKATGRSAVVGTTLVLTGGAVGAGARGLLLGLGARTGVATVASSGLAGGAANGAAVLSSDVYDAMAFGDSQFTGVRGYAVTIGVGAVAGIAMGAYSHSITTGAPILNRLPPGLIQARLPSLGSAIRSLQSRLVVSSRHTATLYENTLLGRATIEVELRAFTLTRRVVGIPVPGQGPVVIDTDLVRGNNVIPDGEVRIAPKTVDELTALAARENKTWLARKAIGFERLAGVHERQAGTAQARSYIARGLPDDAGTIGDVNLLATTALENGTLITRDVTTIVRPLTRQIQAGLLNGAVIRPGHATILWKGQALVVPTESVTVVVPGSGAAVTIIGIVLP